MLEKPRVSKKAIEAEKELQERLKRRADIVRAKDGQGADIVRTKERHCTDKGETLNKYNIRLDASVWERLGQDAKERGTSRGAIIRELINNYFRRV